MNKFLRIAYQIPEDNTEIVGRSFEDSFILANKALFKLDNESSPEKLEERVFKKSKAIGNKSKTSFALKYGVEVTDWQVPKYITEGLIWLDKD